jgi:zinc D-Ala-D-Ala carboxypeptidase
MTLSDHFSLMELCKSQTAERLGIDNAPDDAAIANLKSMCENILEPIRAHYGVPFSPSSGYRSEELNKAIGGSSTSAHVRGLAVDIEIPLASVSNPDLARWVQANLVFDQCILECWTGEPGSGWVHIGDNIDDPRGQVLTYTRGKGYMNGLPA